MNTITNTVSSMLRFGYYRKDKAIEEEETGWNDIIKLNACDLKRKLKVGRGTVSHRVIFD